MSVWEILVWAATCGMGVLAFLKAVANEVDRTEANLRRLEQTERKSSLKHRQAAGENITESPAAAA